MNGKKAKMLRGLAAVKAAGMPVYQLVEGTQRNKKVLSTSGALNIDGTQNFIYFTTGTLELPPGARKLYKSLKKLYKHGS